MAKWVTALLQEPMFKSLDFLSVLAVVCSALAPANPTDAHTGAAGDRAGLLAFRSTVWGNLTDWGSPHMCNWTGVTCDGRRRVVYLLLPQSNLYGVISPALGNLSVLMRLDLNDNRLSGSIPPELGALSQLIDLSLYNNILSGPIPPELGRLKSLTYIGLESNDLSGSIPEALFCNCSSLQHIDLSDNHFTGEIRFPGQCRLSELSELILYTNKLVGRIPPSVSNSTKLHWVLLQSNLLAGELPSQMFDKMPSLQFLHLSNNKLLSNDKNNNLEPFIASLINCTSLQELGIARNRVGGEIPPFIGNMSAMLNILHLNGNNISGQIPPGIGSLNLTNLDLSDNQLDGTIPPEIWRPRWLAQVNLSNNLLTGDIPPSLGGGLSLGLIDISRNRLHGSIPNTFSNLTQLDKLLLHHNQLSGAIPPSFGSNPELNQILDLSYNKLTGQVPTDMARLSSFSLYLNLSNNLLEGPLPPEIGKMAMTQALDLSSNRFSGAIPAQIEGCVALEYLNLSRNALQGALPVSIGSLRSIHVLDVSFNDLTGAIPQSLQACKALRLANFSYNRFSGEVPGDGAFKNLTSDSFLGNPDLCGSLPGMARCGARHARLLFVLVAVIVVASFLMVLCVIKYLRKTCLRTTGLALRSSRRPTSRPVRAAETESEHPRISHRELADATGGFSEENLIGAGGFGHVYRGILHDGTAIAVKVLDSDGSASVSGTFERECQVLKRVRHRNLIRVITACSTPDFKAVVLPLMPNGCLESLIHPPTGKPLAHRLDLGLLLSIASNVAEGMAYLHHHAPFTVVHCDLKPSNVLLDDDMTAIVSDFGISRLEDLDTTSDVSAPCNSITGLLQGSIGYIAPEYGIGGHPSTQGDVYSFGVVLLEMITGRRPTEVIADQGCGLHDWVKSRYDPHDVGAVVERSPLWDPPPPPSLEGVGMEIVGELIELGVACSRLSPSLRPTMADVAQQIAYLKEDAFKNYKVAFMTRRLPHNDILICKDTRYI